MKENAKQKLLKVAAEEFANKGYNGASTRDIVNKAGMNISAISYYFGGKEGLYSAIMEEIVGEVNALTDDLFVRYDELKLAPSPAAAKELLYIFIKRILTILCTKQISDDKCKIYLHEYAASNSSFDFLDFKVNARFFSASVDLLIIISGGKITEKEAILFTFMFFSQMFTIFIRKNKILRLMKWEDYGEKEMDFILGVFDLFIGANNISTKSSQ